MRDSNCGGRGGRRGVGRGRRRIGRGPDGTTLVVHLEGETSRWSIRRSRAARRFSVRMRRFVEDQQHLYNRGRRRSDRRRGGAHHAPGDPARGDRRRRRPRHPRPGRDVITRSRRSLEVWRDEDDYESAQRRKEPKFASTSLGPARPVRESIRGEQPYAFLTGIVRDGGERTSSISGKPFVWALGDARSLVRRSRHTEASARRFWHR